MARKFREDPQNAPRLTKLGRLLEEDRRAKLMTAREYAAAVGIHFATLVRVKFSEGDASEHRTGTLDRIATYLGYGDRASLAAKLASME